MGQFFHIHAETPQQRLIQQACTLLDEGGLAIVPTDTGYCFACKIGDKRPLDRLLMLRQLEKNHHFTLLCYDLKVISSVAYLPNNAFKTVKQAIPGPFVFVLKANKELPKRILNIKRRTIGVRVPQGEIIRAILASYGEPLLSSTLLLPNDDVPMSDPELIYQRLGAQVDLVIDGGYMDQDLTTVVNLANETPEIIREGKGDITILGLESS